MMKKLQKSKRRIGAIVVLFAFAMIPMLGITALAIEGGILQDQRRKLQAAADAAALAAADDLFLRYATNQGLDPGNNARNAAIATMAGNGFTQDMSNPNGTTNINVYIPPITGLFIGRPGYAEVTIQTTQNRTFSTIFGADKLPVFARAVARGAWIYRNVGILLLDPVDKDVLSSSGNGLITVMGASVNVNSTNMEGAISSGGGTMIAPEFDFGGDPGYVASGGGTFSGTIISNAAPNPDPLAYLPPPTTTGMVNQGNANFSGHRSVTLSPGYYPNGIHISAGANVTLLPGIYYMASGGFQCNTNEGGSLTANGVMIYNEGSGTNDGIDISGQGAVTMTPMTTGPYQGIMFYQNRNSTTPISISGGGNMHIDGTFYAASAELKITGNGAENYIGSQYISWKATFGGNGNIIINWANGAARTRVIGLVE